ncbi:hypothetical protein HK405_000333, partial [Cladochytrium tenue]
SASDLPETATTSDTHSAFADTTAVAEQASEALPAGVEEPTTQSDSVATVSGATDSGHASDALPSASEKLGDVIDDPSALDPAAQDAADQPALVAPHDSVAAEAPTRLSVAGNEAQDAVQPPDDSLLAEERPPSAGVSVPADAPVLTDTPDTPDARPESAHPPASDNIASAEPLSTGAIWDATDTAAPTAMESPAPAAAANEPQHEEPSSDAPPSVLADAAAAEDSGNIGTATEPLVTAVDHALADPAASDLDGQAESTDASGVEPIVAE